MTAVLANDNKGKYKRIKTIRSLLPRDDLLVNQVCHEGKTALHYAVKNSAPCVVMVLLTEATEKIDAHHRTAKDKDRPRVTWRLCKQLTSSLAEDISLTHSLPPVFKFHNALPTIDILEVQTTEWQILTYPTLRAPLRRSPLSSWSTVLSWKGARRRIEERIRNATESRGVRN